MPTVSGVWKWNDNPVVNSAIDTVYITFTCNSTSYTSISISNMTSGPGNICYGPTNNVVYGSDLSNTWRDQAYRTLDFGSSPQEVSQDFYNYLTANAVQQSTTVKAVSSANLAEFKAKCDETYAAIGNIPTVSTELINLGTLSTSGTLTADQATQIGTTTVGVTARASVNSVTRFYERVNISGTTATLVSADDDALHVLTVNLSTRAYTLSDVELGGDSNPTIPTPTTSDNGKVLGVANGAYALQTASGMSVGYAVSAGSATSASMANTASSATKATQDASGNVITETYVKKADLFPVGAYYITESSTTPASLFGGEWVRVANRFLYGALDNNNLGREGGAQNVLLKASDLPPHAHIIYAEPNKGSMGGLGFYDGGGGYNPEFLNEGHLNMVDTGGQTSVNIMPPYRTVNIWRRTA